MSYYDFDAVDATPAVEPEAAELFYKFHAAGEVIPEESMTFFWENPHLTVTHPVCLQCCQAVQPHTGRGRPRITCSESCKQKLKRKRMKPMPERHVIANLGEGEEEYSSPEPRFTGSGKYSGNGAYSPREAHNARLIGDLVESGHGIAMIAEDLLDMEKKLNKRFFKETAGEAASYWLTFYDRYGRAPTAEEVPYHNETYKHEFTSPVHNTEPPMRIVE